MALLLHVLYSQCLAPSDNHLFGLLNQHLEGKKLNSSEALQIKIL